MDPSLNHVIVLGFVPSCESDSAIAAHTHGIDEVRVHIYDHQLTGKCLNTLYICYRLYAHNIFLRIVIPVCAFFYPPHMRNSPE